jgi:hypothetical protein
VVPDLPGVAPGSSSGIFRGRQVVVGGGQNGFGIFFYNGTPGPGNPPIFAAVAPGTTLDPYGNTVSAVVNIGVLSGAHAGFDANGVEYLSDPTGATRILIDPSGTVIEFLDSLGTGHNAPLMTLASAAGTDRFTGAPFPAGINLPGLPLTAGDTVMDVNGIRTYSALPPTLGGLLSSLGVTAQFTDSAGNVVLPGDTSYSNAIVGYSLAMSLQGGTLFVYNAASFAGPWTSLVQIGGLQNDGEMHFQATGGAHLVADTILYKLSDGGFGREIWQDMRPLANSFVGTIANRYPPQYRLAPDGNVEVAGFVQFPPSGGPNFNSITFATVPLHYRPGNNTGHKWPITLETNVTPVGTPCVQVDTSGNFQFHNLPTSGLLSTIASIYGRYPLNATQMLTS